MLVASVNPDQRKTGGTDARINLPDYAEQKDRKRANDAARSLSFGIFLHATLWLKPVLVGQFEFLEWTPDRICASYCTSS
jgi:hypothetical protein